MHQPVFNPLVFAGGLLCLFLLVRAVVRGSMSYSVGVVSKARNPVAFWFLLTVNAVIMLAFFLMAFGLLKK